MKDDNKLNQIREFSPALLAATLSAFAGAAHAGNKIGINSSDIDIAISSDIKKEISKINFKETNFDANVFSGMVFVDEKEIEIDPAILAAAIGTNGRLDNDSSSCGSVDCEIIDCYDACHGNCHGSRSWR